MTQHSPFPQELESAMRRLLDENAILTLLARFDDVVIRQDMETFRQLWVEDGVWEIGQFNPTQAKDVYPIQVHGVDQIVALLQQFNTTNEFFFRTTLRGVITLNGDRASVRTPTTEYARRHDGHGYNNVGLYQDELERRNGNWLFVARRYYYVWVDSSSAIAGSAVPSPRTFTDQ